MTHSSASILSCLYEESGPKTKRYIRCATVFFAIVIVLLLALIIYRFYATGQLDSHYWYFFARGTTWLFLAKGFAGTLIAAFVSGIVAFALGFIMLLGRISDRRILKGTARAFIEFTRGVPTLLFIYFFFLALPALGLRLPALLKISLPVAISASGVVAEVLRSGVNAVPKGQSEAAFSLGLNKRITFFRIVFPQAFRYVIPSLISEIVIVVKDTTFAYIVNFPDIMQNAHVLISNYDAMLSVYLLVAIIYILLNYALNKISDFFAHKEGSLTRKQDFAGGIV